MRAVTRPRRALRSMVVSSLNAAVRFTTSVSRNSSIFWRKSSISSSAFTLTWKSFSAFWRSMSCCRFWLIMMNGAA
jgi:hypothetical protein